MGIQRRRITTKRAPHTADGAEFIKRCHNPSDSAYPNYGGRGIIVCDRWRHSFAAFLEDMGEPPTGLSLDRWPDNNGNYEPGNVRWATDLEQAANKRMHARSRLIEFNGITLPVRQWAKRIGVSPFCLSHRLKKMSEVEALSKPPKRRRPQTRRGLIEFQGEKHTARQWAARIGITENTLNIRFLKWPIKRALTQEKRVTA